MAHWIRRIFWNFKFWSNFDRKIDIFVQNSTYTKLYTSYFSGNLFVMFSNVWMKNLRIQKFYQKIERKIECEKTSNVDSKLSFWTIRKTIKCFQIKYNYWFPLQIRFFVNVRFLWFFKNVCFYENFTSDPKCLTFISKMSDFGKQCHFWVILCRVKITKFEILECFYGV